MKYEVFLNNKKYEIEVDECSVALKGVSEVAAPAVSAPVASAPAPAPAAAPTASASGTSVVSPMPGTILAVNITNGQTVRAGEVLFILEAMKMENDIVAPCDGIVKQVLVTKGTTVETDQVLAII
ncbi:MAG: acetyl-CoA carboxylase biotin carboxyl carrier protein subunit [Clostridia bacterium]|nr:acetyl-CoA carboxylase biotin carboxyl carrier protein subunit [Clostridia bacterium]MBQ3127794.1 acetyl-CoA carboxylase biotin carboxyl carrier protein subunit [Clostridia bacterium]